MKHQIQGLCRRQVNDREIHVRDAIAAKEWYGEILGVRTHRYAPGWKSFVLGDIDREHEFTLIQAAQPAGSGRLSRLDQREFMFAVNVAQHEALPAGGVPMSAHPEDLAVPFFRGDRVAHMDFPIVDLAAAETLDLMFHRIPPSIPGWASRPLSM